ncbi:guanine deaminase [Simiduia sp. 21SJ11W-1]|uniref:guanine deaminase n=1 Tax=Simiduia sp. 21SJ11W-1 TaxID=2909669 RepID=UPI00209D30FE|nr:guanine deaminase [Simiduia sp. 21SJ11W-1]UTA48285.1 guanine deaminase [Simiduia sp. 21SJ11W-1]
MSAPANPPGSVALRARILHFTAKPTGKGEQNAVQYFDDGVLLVEKGQVTAVAPAEAMAQQGFDLSRCEHLPDHLVMPGFIDSHIHCPQLDVMASYGEQLLDWLNRYTFPAELKFSDPQYAALMSELFLDRLLAAGTTTALAYATVHAHAADALFHAAQKRNLRLVAGRVMMDRNAPENLTDTAASGERDDRRLIEQWHGQGRLHYALTPRFAPTSSPEQLLAAGRLYVEYSGLYMQTHLSENLAELDWIKSLYPKAKHYLDVYDQAGLLGPRSVFGHGIHLSDDELARLAATGSSVAFCPSSNLFLGSGLLDLARLQAAGVAVNIATDVGAGTSFSQLRTLADAYRVLQLQGQSLDALTAFYQLTLGNAQSLHLDHCLGNFSAGKDADFVVINLAPDALQARRQSQVASLEEALFALMILGDERNIARTYAAGSCVYQNNN